MAYGSKAKREEHSERSDHHERSDLSEDSEREAHGERSDPNNGWNIPTLWNKRGCQIVPNVRNHQSSMRKPNPLKGRVPTIRTLRTMGNDMTTALRDQQTR